MTNNNELKNKVSRLNMVFLLAIIVWAVVGSFYIHHTWNTHISEASKQAIGIAKTIEATINGEIIKELRGVTEDEGTLPFNNIKERLENVSNIYEKVRFVYIYTQRNDKIYFMVDAEPANSEDYSPPGQEYTEASIEYKKAFVEGKTIITEPVTDRWGTWISALVPIRHNQTDSVIAVLGMDYPAEIWKQEAISHTVISGIIVLAVLLLLIAFYIILYKNKNLKKEQEKLTNANKIIGNSEEQYRLLVTQMHDGLAVHEILYDEYGNALDYRFIRVNKSFEKLTGLMGKDIIGKTVLEVMPNTGRNLIETYGKVALTGDTYQYEKYSDELNKYISVSAYSTKKNQFAIMVSDITDKKKAEEALNYQLQFEKTVSDISAHFVSLPSDQLTNGINYALKLTGEFFQVDRSYVFQFSEDIQTMSITYEWCAEGIKPQINKFQGFPVDSLPWWAEQIKTYGYVYIPDVDNLRVVAEKVEFKSQGIKSLLCVSLTKDGSLFGFFGFDAVKEKKAWTKEHVTLLKVVAELISNAFARYMAEEKIRQLSFHDSLTGLYNRAYLSEEMQRLDTKRQLPISIIMADLNGLKLVNDTYGHSTGDMMLQGTAEILSKSCRQEDIIARWGGDEFIILLPQTSENEAYSIYKRIIDECRKYYVEDVPISIALGVATKNNEESMLKDTLKISEDNMYKHKLTESRSAKSAVLSALLKTLAAKSFETEEHTVRMLAIAQKIGDKIGLSTHELGKLSLLVTLHDIGKVNIPENILTKQGALTQEEWETIKKHPEIGHKIALATENFAHVANDILCHHERWDGTGYPQGLKNEEIPLLARITAIADAFEVMSNGRPYRKASSQSEIIKEFKECSGTQFDPDLVELFIQMLEKDEN